jgi:1-acyl-sn-glycerol-3-phosphate acyltransferase
MSPWAHLKSAVSLTVITLNLVFWLGPVFALALAKLLPAARGGRVDRTMERVYRAAVAVDDWWLRHVIGIRWSRPRLGLDCARSYLVLSNHVSWTDILLVQSVIARDGPLVKFLAKRELLFVPIVGLICWAFDFPLLRRRSRPGEDDVARRWRDLEALREACRTLARHPAALMNFAEGSRFSEARRLDSGSRYRHLLEPRVGGLLTLVEALGGELEAVVDLTLIYPRSVSFWRFLSGAVPEVEILAEVIDPATLPRTREEASRWLETRWARKDAAIESARSRTLPPDGGV